jgi:hypothetical protein
LEFFQDYFFEKANNDELAKVLDLVVELKARFALKIIHIYLSELRNG